jgi:phosphatidylglycerophosphatase A
MLTTSNSGKRTAPDRLAVWLATGFGLGKAPFASGTVGSLPGLALAFALAPLASSPWGIAAQAAVALGLAALAVPICGRAEALFGRKDDGRIVADEYLCFPLAAIGLPLVKYPWLLAVVFVVVRALDVIKPPPANGSQRWRGGLGIVADDFISNLYALAVCHGLSWWLTRG